MAKRRGRPKQSQSPNAIVRLQLDAAAKEALDHLAELRGMTQLAVLSRLVKWFTTQDEVIQAAALGLMSSDRLAELVRFRQGEQAGGGR